MVLNEKKDWIINDIKIKFKCVDVIQKLVLNEKKDWIINSIKIMFKCVDVIKKIDKIYSYSVSKNKVKWSKIKYEGNWRRYDFTSNAKY